jgi:hypothetical protein
MKNIHQANALFMRMKISLSSFAIRRALSRTLATREKLGSRTKLLFALLIFLVSFATKSLQAVDLAPVMYTAQQPFGGLTDTYDSRAVSIIEGEGILGPYDINPRRTIWIAQAPGYSVFLSLVYRLTNRNFFNVQLLQNLANSISPIIIFFIAGMLISWRTGIAVGMLAAISHHLSHISNYILPDSISALPLLLAFLCLTITMRYQKSARLVKQTYMLYVLAGIMLGFAAWLRSQTMLLAFFLVIMLTLISIRRLRLTTIKRTALMAIVSVLTIAPITIKNYIVYNEFVPINIGAGIVLWEGIADESGDKYGAVAKDDEVAAQDAIFYNEPRYAGTWSSPDGIMRDRDRVKRSLEIIKAHPVWYAGVMVKRAREMVKYSAHASLVAKPVEAKSQELQMQENPQPVRKPLRELAASSSQSPLEVGRKLFYFRPLFRALQRMSKESMQVFILLGLIAVFILSRRRAWFVLITPIYYFIFQGFFHSEFRYTLPMQYFVFTFAAVTWVLLVTPMARGIVKIGNKIRHFRAAVS